MRYIADILDTNNNSLNNIHCIHCATMVDSIGQFKALSYHIVGH